MSVPISLHGRFEAAFFADVPVASPCEVELIVEFTDPAGERRRVRAFWYGSREWRVRFMPTVVGAWTFRTHSVPRLPGLDAQSGAFTCAPSPLLSVSPSPFLQHGPLRVAPNGRHLAHTGGTPFFWLGDTVWNGPMMARNATDWDRFLTHRAAQKFNVIQFVMTHWRAGATNPDGEVAYTGRDPIWINPHWFERLDARFDAIEAHGLLAAPVLIWTLGRDEINPSTLPESQIVKLARYMVARYGAHHVVWILNGDGRYYGPAAEKWKRIGRAVFDLGGHAPVVQHPGGMQWPHDTFEKEKWIDLIGYQGGHGDDAETWQWLHSGPPARKWKKYSPRPFLNLEPPYEDHICYQSRRRHDAYNIRRASWWSLLNAPPAGLTYGAHGLWGWEEIARPPTDHAYTGVAQPWHVAMKLPGAKHMTHMAEFFRALPWTKLTPDQSLVRSAPVAPKKPGRLHAVFSRDADGETAIWLNGEKKNGAWLGGDFSTWVPEAHLALGNEATGDFGWSGTFHRVAIYDRALSAAEIAAAQRTPEHHAPDAIAAWSFKKSGTTIPDESARGASLNLRIVTPDCAKITSAGLVVRADAEVKSIGPAEKLAAAARASGAISFELWFTPAEWDHRACGRLLSMQVDRWNRNFSVTQIATALTGHIRTSATAGNAEPSLATAVPSSPSTFVAAARTPSGDCAVFYLPTGGALHIAPRKLQHGLSAAWFDPRTGKRRSTRTKARGFFEAPDASDWVLVLRR